MNASTTVSVDVPLFTGVSNKWYYLNAVDGVTVVFPGTVMVIGDEFINVKDDKSDVLVS